MTKRKQIRPFSVIIGILVTLLACIYLYPIFLVVINSFKPFKDMFESYISLPKGLYLNNYITALNASGFWQQMLNNLIITVLSVCGVLIVPSMAAYKLCRTKSRLSSFFYMVFTVPFLVPFYSYMIPLVKLMDQLHLSNSLIGLSLFWIGTSSFAFFMFHGFVKTIPAELDEAARIDGCSDFGIFLRIILPLLRPINCSVVVLYAIWTWNDFLLPFLMLTDPSKHTITISVYQMFGKFGSDWDIITATLVLATLPMVIVYLVLQRYVVDGIVAGSVKG